MMNVRKACQFAIIGGALLVPAAAMAGDHGMYDTVKDMTGASVHSTNGNCVYTMWMGSGKGCDAMPTSLHHLSKAQRTVYFDFNKSTLNVREKAKLDSLAQLIKASKEVTSVDIVGYADQMGDTGYNQALSKRRANTVKAFMASKGLKTRSVHVEGMGESGSVTSCDSGLDRNAMIACLAADRRVEVELNFVQ